MSQTLPHISIRDHMVAQAVPDNPFVSALQTLGINAFELQIDADGKTPHLQKAAGIPFDLSGHPDVAELRELLAARSLRVSALLLATDFSTAFHESNIDFAVEAINLAQAFGVAAVRIDPLSRDKSVPAATIQKNLIRTLRHILERTSTSQVALAIENHGLIANDPAFLDAVLAALPDPRIGLTLDTGNFYWWGMPLPDVYSLLQKYAPRARHTHIKSIHYPPSLQHTRREPGHDYAAACCSLAEGDLDLSRVVRILVEANYAGDLCIENESLTKRPIEARLKALQEDVDVLRTALDHVVNSG